MATSTVSLNFARPICFSRRTASAGAYNAFGSTSFALSMYRLPCLPIRIPPRLLSLPGLLSLLGPQATICRVGRPRRPSRPRRLSRRIFLELADDLDAHGPRGALNHAHRRLHVVGVEIPHLLRRDVAHLGAGDLANLGLVGLARSLLDPRSLAEQHRRRRCLGDEGKRAVGVHHDLHRDDRPHHGGSPLVVRLAELHDVHAVLSQRGPDGWRRRGLPRGNLQPDHSNDLLRHPSTSVYTVFPVFPVFTVSQPASRLGRLGRQGRLEFRPFPPDRSLAPPVWHDRRWTPARGLSPSRPSLRPRRR